jgi:DNA-binding GntR family transcriptional regulator
MPPVKAPRPETGAAREDGEGSRFVKARRVRSFDDVVEQVRGAIIDGSILAGERLPSERELAEQFGVSRATLREALRALEAVGLIEIRVGAHGGAFATEAAVERSVDFLRQMVDVEVAARPHDVRRFRASLHADNATWVEDSPQALTELAEAVPRGARAFLMALAASSRMPLRVALAAAVEPDEPGRGDPSLSTSEMEHAVDLLRQGRRVECRELLFRLLSGSQEIGNGR